MNMVLITPFFKYNPGGELMIFPLSYKTASNLANIFGLPVMVIRTILSAVNNVLLE